MTQTIRNLVLAGLLVVCGFLGDPAKAQQQVSPCAAGISATGAQSCASLLPPQASNYATEAYHILKATGPSSAVDFQVNNTGASALWVMLFDAAVAPTGGGAAVTGCTLITSARPCVAKWYQIGANSTIGVTWSAGPFVQLLTGQLIACSTTGPFTLTYTEVCVFSGEAM
jgi:hypothetical protein